MALTTRVNGNLISATWFNDFNNLLTGVMQDQEVTIKQNLVLAAIGAGPGLAFTPTASAGAGMGIGLYQYAYSYVSADGESHINNGVTSVTTTGGNQRVSITGITVGPTGTTGRNIYRSVLGGGTLRFLTQIADNVTTTYTDSAADSTLTWQQQTNFSSLGGSLILRDSFGFTTTRIGNDGGFNHLFHMYSYNGPPPFAPSLALTASTALGTGVYKYVMTWGMSDGESLQSPVGTITTTAGNQGVVVTSVPIGPPDTSFRKIYRTTVGGSVFHFVTILFDNVTTSYTDITPDASISGSASPPTHPSFGGGMSVKDTAGTNFGQWYSDGYFQINDAQGSVMGLSGGNVQVVNGGTSGTASLYQIMQGSVKITYIILNNFRTAGADQQLTFPAPYTGVFNTLMWTGDTDSFDLLHTGLQTSARLQTAFGTITTNGTNVSTGGNHYFGSNFYLDVGALGFEQIQFKSGWAAAHNGSIFIIGS